MQLKAKKILLIIDSKKSPRVFQRKSVPCRAKNAFALLSSKLIQAINVLGLFWERITLAGVCRVFRTQYVKMMYRL